MARALLAISFPLVELVLGPWALTGWHGGDDLPGALRPVGWVVVAVSLAVLADAHVRFVVEGQGTPSPLRPPRRLVRGGVYRFLRHPMYVATAAALVGEALILRRAVLLIAAGAYALTLAALVRWWEAPQLRRQFPEG